MEIQEGLCCGLVEISGIQAYRSNNAKGVVDSVVAELYVNSGDTRPPAFIIYTTASPNKKAAAIGERLARHIEAAGLGAVSCSSANMNLNSGNYVRVYVWTVNLAALRARLEAYEGDHD